MTLRLFNDLDLTKHLSEDIRGFTVFAADNTRIGEIEELWIDPERKTIQFASARVHPKARVREDKVHFHFNHLRIIGRSMVKTDKQLNDILKLSSRIKLPPKGEEAVSASPAEPAPVEADVSHKQDGLHSEEEQPQPAAPEESLENDVMPEGFNAPDDSASIDPS